MSINKSGRIEVEYTECTKEWLRMWVKDRSEANALRIQLEETLETIFGLELSVQLFEVERSGCLVIVRWFYVEDTAEALASVIDAEISHKEIRFRTTGDLEAHYLANHFKRTLCIALYDVKKFGANVYVTGKPYLMTVPYAVIDPCTGEVIIEANKEFELSFALIERIESIIETWAIEPTATSLYIIGEVVAATHVALLWQAARLLNKESTLHEYLSHSFDCPELQDLRQLL